MQFFLLIPFFVSAYANKRQRFWIMAVVVWTLSSIVCLLVIIREDLSVSYFSYNNDYWTLYYEKPWSRLPAYLIGIVMGCCYYTYKHEDNEEEFLEE